MLDLAPVAHDLVTQLRDETGCSAQLAIRDRREALIVFDAVTTGACNGRMGVATRLPAHSSALGRSLLLGVSDEELARLYAVSGPRQSSGSDDAALAELGRDLQEDRMRGYVLVGHRSETDARDIAAPIRRGPGEIIAAVGLTRRSGATSTDDRDLARKVLGTAHAIGTRLTTRATQRMAGGAHR